MTRRRTLARVLAAAVVAAAIVPTLAVAAGNGNEGAAPFRPRGSGRKGTPDKAWEIRLHDGLEALNDKRFDDAERLLGQAVDEAGRLGPDRTELARALDGLGVFYAIRKRYAEADRTLTRALETEEKASGPHSVGVAECLEHLFLVRMNLKKYDSAESLARRALSIRERNGGAEDPENVESLQAIAMALSLKGKLDQAEPFWTRTLALVEKTDGPESEDAARVLQDKALIALQAAFQARFSLALFPASPTGEPDTLPKAAPASPDELQRQAEALFERVLAIREKAQGTNHPDYLETLDNLLGSLALGNDTARARPWLERSLAIREQRFGPDHPEVAEALSALADNQMSRGEYRQAVSRLRRAVAINENAPAAAVERAEKTKPDYEAQLARAVRTAEVMGDPARRPTVAGLKSINSLMWSDKARDVNDLVNRTSLMLDGSRLDDAGLGHVSPLVNLESLSIGGGFTDDGLAHLEPLEGLKKLTIRQEVSTGGDAPLAGLGALFGPGPIAGIVRLSNRAAAATRQPAPRPLKPISGAGLAHLETLAHLEELTVYGPSGIDDDALVHLTKLEALEELVLIGSKLHGPGLEHLRGLARLRALNVASSPINDAGLAHLPPLTALRSLNLASTQVTDAGLAHLKRLKGLRELDLGDTAVTEAGIADLKRALPDLKATYGERPALGLPQVIAAPQVGPRSDP